MYTTRSLSEYRRNPSEAPHEGPNSGILVIQDQDPPPQIRPVQVTGRLSSYLVMDFYLSGLPLPQNRTRSNSVVDFYLSGLPLPQNLKLTVIFDRKDENTSDRIRVPIVFIPVLDKPLSSNCYYAVERCGKHLGKASASAKEGDKVPCCFCFSYVPPARPKQLDPYDIYQQFMIYQTKPFSRYYRATSLAPDGIPPWFLSRHEWRVEYSRSQEFELRDDAKGINKELRSELPGLGLSVLVGKWYVPFIFVKGDPKNQFKSSMYYSMTLEQRWEEVFSCENDKSENCDVVVDVEVEDEVVMLEGQRMSRGVDANGFVWFGVGVKKIGLGSVVVERIKWEEERFGWTSKGDQKRAMAVKRLEKPKDGSLWKRYHCYVLTESFVLKRRDESLVLTYEFRHVNKLKSKWDY